jgi:hypothetical protein
LTWSPDSKQIIAATVSPLTYLPNYYLLDTGRLNESPIRITDIQTTMDEWNIIAKTKTVERLSVLKPLAATTLTPLMKILSFSPDETKILYEATASATILSILNPPLIGSDPTPENRDVKTGNIYVYDIKEDRNYLIGDVKTLGFVKPTPTPAPRTRTRIPIPTATPAPEYSDLSDYNGPLPVQWLPTSKHLIAVSKDKIEAMDYDATNRKTLYSGPFLNGFVVPWSNASKLLILTTLNSATSYPNLYAVNLR